MNNAEKFKQMFGFYATEMWAKSEQEFLDWINAEYVQENSWIPCSERLPDKDGIYLVTHRKFGKLEVTWNIFYGGEHASWLWNDEIIAWMPLPEPYKGEES